LCFSNESLTDAVECVRFLAKSSQTAVNPASYEIGMAEEIDGNLILAEALKKQVRFAMILIV